MQQSTGEVNKIGSTTEPLGPGEHQNKKKTNGKKSFWKNKNRDGKATNSQNQPMYQKRYGVSSQVTYNKLCLENNSILEQHIFIGTYFLPGASIASTQLGGLKSASMTCFRNLCKLYEIGANALYIADLRSMPNTRIQLTLEQREFWKESGNFTHAQLALVVSHSSFSSKLAGITCIQRPIAYNPNTVHEYIITEIESSADAIAVVSATSRRSRQYTVHLGKYLMITGDVRLMYYLIYKQRELSLPLHVDVDIVVIQRVRLMVPMLPVQVVINYNDVLNVLHMELENRERSIMSEIFRLSLIHDVDNNAALMVNDLSFDRSTIYQIRILVKDWLILSNLNYESFLLDYVAESPLIVPSNILTIQEVLTRSVFMDVPLWKSQGILSGVLLPPNCPTIYAAATYNLVYDCTTSSNLFSDDDLQDLGYGRKRACKLVVQTRLALLNELLHLYE